MKKKTKSIVNKLLPLDPAFDLTGKRFGKWLVLEYAGKKGFNRLWLCRCECGVEKNVSGSNLLGKLSTQCQRCAWDSRRKPHKKLSIAWMGMKRRRKLPKEWRDFDAFREAVGDPPNDFAHLGRYFFAMPHGPENTFWITKESASQVQQIRQKLKEEFILKNRVLMKIRNAKTKDEIKHYLIAARKAGYTYELLGIAAGVTHQRIQQIIAQFMEE
jgi:hypothetical protein